VKDGESVPLCAPHSREAAGRGSAPTGAGAPWRWRSRLWASTVPWENAPKARPRRSAASARPRLATDLKRY